MIGARSPIVHYLKSIERYELALVCKVPLAISFIISILVYYFNADGVITHLISEIPTISSIFIGFLSVILVASISTGDIFDKMKSDEYNNKEVNDNIFSIFFRGVFFNIILEVVLLFLSLSIGSFNSSFTTSMVGYSVETFLILFFLISSSLLLINNLDRVYQITTFMQKRFNLLHLKHVTGRDSRF